MSIAAGPPVDQVPAGRMAEHVDQRVRRRRHHLGGCPGGALAELGVRRRDHPVQLGQHVVGVVERPVGEDVDLGAGQQLEPLGRELRGDLADRADVLAQPADVESDARLERVHVRRVLRDGEVAVATRHRRPRHLLDAVLAVGCGRVRVQVAPDVVDRDEARHLAGPARVELAHALPQLGRQVRVAEALVQLGFSGGRRAAPRARRRQRAVVRVRTGEPLQRRDVPVRHDRVQRHARAVAGQHRRARRRAVDDGADGVGGGERRDDGGGHLGRDQQLDRVEPLVPPPQGADGGAVGAAGLGRQPGQQAVGQIRRLVQQQPASATILTRVLHPAIMY